jgi:hypothetical protein
MSKCQYDAIYSAYLGSLELGEEVVPVGGEASEGLVGLHCQCVAGDQPAGLCARARVHDRREPDGGVKGGWRDDMGGVN